MPVNLTWLDVLVVSVASSGLTLLGLLIAGWVVLRRLGFLKHPKGAALGQVEGSRVPPAPPAPPPPPGRVPADAALLCSISVEELAQGVTKHVRDSDGDEWVVEAKDGHIRLTPSWGGGELRILRESEP